MANAPRKRAHSDFSAEEIRELKRLTEISFGSQRVLTLPEMRFCEKLLGRNGELYRRVVLEARQPIIDALRMQ